MPLRDLWAMRGHTAVSRGPTILSMSHVTSLLAPPPSQLVHFSTTAWHCDSGHKSPRLIGRIVTRQSYRLRLL